MTRSIVLVLLMIVLSPLVMAQDADSAESCFNRAEEFFKSKQYRDAIKELHRALQLNPKWPEAYFKLGLAYYALSPPADPEFKFGYGHKRDPDENSKAALEAFEKAARLKPDWPEALNYVGEYYSRFQEDERAIGILKRALQLRPEFVEAQENLGIAYLYAGRYNEGIEQLNKAISMNPSLARPHKLLGLTDLILDDQVNALVQYKIFQTLDQTMANDLQKWLKSPNKPYIGVHNILNINLLSISIIYPQVARNTGVSGQVVVEVVVDAQGKVVSARALDGHRVLRQAAETAALTARFKSNVVSMKGVVLLAFRNTGY